jgi:hypothetical protein
MRGVVLSCGQKWRCPKRSLGHSQSERKSKGPVEKHEARPSVGIVFLMPPSSSVSCLASSSTDRDVAAAQP